MEGNNLDEWNEWEPPTVQIMSDLGEKFDENGSSERSEKYEKANGQLPAEDELVYGRPSAMTGLSPQQNKKGKDEKNGPARKQQGIKRYVGPDSLPLHIVRSGVGANGDCYFTPVSCFLLNR